MMEGWGSWCIFHVVKGLGSIQAGAYEAAIKRFLQQYLLPNAVLYPTETFKAGYQQLQLAF